MTEQAINQERAVLELFAAFMQDRGLDTVTRQIAVEYLDTIPQLDPLWARSPAKRKATLAQLRARAVERYEEGLTNRTLNRHVSTMAAFLAWAADRYSGVQTGCVRWAVAEALEHETDHVAPDDERRSVKHPGPLRRAPER